MVKNNGSLVRGCPRWEEKRCERNSGRKPGIPNVQPFRSIFLVMFSYILGQRLNKQTLLGRNPLLPAVPKYFQTGFLHSFCLYFPSHKSCWCWKSSCWSSTKFHNFRFKSCSLIESCATNIVRTQNILFPSADFLILTPFACRSWFWQGNFWLFQAVWHSLRLQEFWMVFSWRTLFFPIRNWKIQYFKHSFWLFLMIFGFT